VRAAFEQWPEANPFEPADPEHLRAWLICRAGWREATPIELPAEATPHMLDLMRTSIEAAIRACGGHAFLTQHRDVVYVVRPKSVAYAAMGFAQFVELREAVEQVIEAEIGVTADQLLEELAA
jgi:hypothetical protein